MVFVTDPNARIAALLRELADAFDDLAERPKPKRKRASRRDPAVAREAARIVAEGLRRQGVRDDEAA